MKPRALLIATTSLAAFLGFAAPVLAQATKKVMLTEVDPSVPTTAWRAMRIHGALIYHDNGLGIGKVKDMLVAANGTVPFVIATNIQNAAERDSGAEATLAHCWVGNGPR